MNRKNRLLSFLLLLALLFAALSPAAGAAGTPPYRGVDVSRWQEDVDWETMKNAGVEFAILRCYSYGKDKRFDENYAGAAAQGIPVGAYCYMYATSVNGAIREAQGALQALDGRALTLPLFLDVEDKTVRALGKTRLTDLMLLELSIFEAAGYDTGIYTSKNFVGVYMDETRLQAFDWWIARWTCYTTDKNPQVFTFADQDPNKGKPNADLWQFSNGGDGSVFGTESEYVDLDYCYTDYLREGEKTPSAHRFTPTATDSTCTQPGVLTLVCDDCGETRNVTFSAALGHTSPGADGLCGRCGERLQAATEGDCPFCHGTHSGPFGWLIALFHRIFALFL